MATDPFKRAVADASRVASPEERAKSAASREAVQRLMAELAGGFVPVVGEGLAARDFRQAKKEGSKFGMVASALGLLPMLGGISTLGKAARGVKSISQAEKVAAELAKTAGQTGKAVDHMAAADRVLHQGETVLAPTLENYRPVRMSVTRDATLPPPPLVSEVIDRMVKNGTLTEKEAARAKWFMHDSKVKTAQFHGTLADEPFSVFDIRKSKDIGHHVGTPGQASTIKQAVNGPVWDKLKQSVLGFGPDDPRWVYSHLDNEAMLAASRTPEGQRIIKQFGPLMRPREGHRIMGPLMIDARNPLVVTDMANWNPSELLDDIAKRGYPEQLGVSDERWAAAADDLLGRGELDFMRGPRYGEMDSRQAIWNLLDDLGSGNLSDLHAPPMRGGRPAQGFDALQYLNQAEDIPIDALKDPFLMPEVTSGWSYIVPHSNQIKSLLGNSGRFDSVNPDIYASLGGAAIGGGLLSRLNNRKEKPQ